MKKFLFLTTLFFLSLFFTKNVFAATEFISVVDTGGSGDYSSLSLWETAVDSDLTSAANLVFAGTKTGTIADGASVTGSISLATGTVYHSTATQIYLIVLTGTFQSAEQIQVDGSNYFTTTDAGDSAIAIAKCRATTGVADTTAVTITDWTTSAANYIKIWTDPSENYRHSGKWDEGKYRLQTTGVSMDILEENIKLDGLQIYTTNDTAYPNGIRIQGTTNIVNAEVSNSISRGFGSYTSVNAGAGIIISSGASGSTIKAWNNIVYDFGGGGNGTGIRNNDSDVTAYWSNNTVTKCTYGNYVVSGTVIAKNNIFYNNTTDYFGTFDSASTNNLSKDATAPGAGACPGANCYYRNKTLSFLNTAAGSEDFHLALTDADAIDKGADLSADANLPFATDIDGETRSIGSGWDIGADEYSATLKALFQGTVKFQGSVKIK